MRIALGFRAHSGWAAMVAVSGTLRSPRILDRRRIVIADPNLPGSKQPYHYAAGLPFPHAEILIAKAVESSRSLAAEALSAALDTLRSQGHEGVACAVLVGSGKPLPSLERILASHALIHTAEGVLFRDVISWAAQQAGLSVTAISEKSLDPASLDRLAPLGKQLGPPWTQDQKLATAAALTALPQLSGARRVSA
ncbi:MAG: hypothetical protein ABI972_24610 [Acidobacteriota bacterium]